LFHNPLHLAIEIYWNPSPCLKPLSQTLSSNPCLKALLQTLAITCLKPIDFLKPWNCDIFGLRSRFSFVSNTGHNLLETHWLASLRIQLFEILVWNSCLKHLLKTLASLGIHLGIFCSCWPCLSKYLFLFPPP
jgi:hypothetical protein